MAGGTVRCHHCTASLTVTFSHSGFGDEHYFYCDACGNVATIDWYTKEYRPFREKYIKEGSYQAGKKRDLERFEQDTRAMKSEISQYLASCPCGGRFSVDAIPRCPTCKTKLDWAKMVKQFDAIPSAVSHCFSRYAKKGWQDVYYFLFNDQLVLRNPWKKSWTIAKTATR